MASSSQCGPSNGLLRDGHIVENGTSLLQSDGLSATGLTSFPNLKLFQMDTEIAVMESLIDNLRRRRASTSKRRNQYARISCLPPEILSEIFVAALDAEASYMISNPSEATTLPLVLGQVCSEWRGIAWSLSEIWASFHCRVSKKKSSRQAVILSEWLSRSDRRLLSVRISFDDEDAWRDKNASTTLLDALVPHCHRLRHLDLVLPEAWYDKFFQVRRNLENLEFLSIRPPGFIFVLREVDMFSQATQLQRISVSHYYLHDVSLPWCQITNATLGTASTDEGIELLRRCPNLTSCRFVDLNPVEGQFTADSIVHPTLRSLDISLDVSTPHFSLILNKLILPGLRHLSVTLPKGHSDPIPSIEALIKRSLCPLRTVDVIGPTIPEQDIIVFLTRTDSVSRLTNKASTPDSDSDAEED